MISSGNVNASVVTCQYPQTYYKSPLEKNALFVFTVIGVMEKVFCWLIFETNILIAVIKILKKYL